MSVPEISVQDASRLLAGDKPPRLIDVREADEWEVSRIPGAELLPLSQWPGVLTGKLTALEAPLIIQCHYGGRSTQAAEFLLHNGFTNVLNLAGGIEAWSLEIDPTVPRY